MPDPRRTFRHKLPPAVGAFLALLPLLVPRALPAYDLEGRVVQHTLNNGMKLLILPRPASPVVALAMAFRTGAADDLAGRSGTAHLLEHMLFKGTEHLGTRDWAREKPIYERIDRAAAILDDLRRRQERDPGDLSIEKDVATARRTLEELQAEEERYIVKDEIDNIYTRNGAESFNAHTGFDGTTYQIELPANRLELWAAIESDRMRNPVLREFYSERDVVLEERRQSYDAQPARLLWELLFGTAFLAHPYQRPVIGWASEIKYLRRAETEDFFRSRYTPNNVVVAVVGNVEPQAFIALMERWFGSVPAGPPIPDLPTREPAQRGERRVFLEADANPVLLIGFHKPTLPQRDDYVLDVVDGLLSGGRTSRLYRRLVEGKLAASVDTSNGTPGGRYDNLFVVSAVPLAPHTPEELEKVIYDELDRLKYEPAPIEELTKVRKAMKADFVRGLRSNLGLAENISYFENLDVGWRYIVTHDRIIDSYTPEDIQACAEKYFTSANRTVAILHRRAGDTIEQEELSDAP